VATAFVGPVLVGAMVGLFLAGRSLARG